MSVSFRARARNGRNCSHSRGAKRSQNLLHTGTNLFVGECESDRFVGNIWNGPFLACFTAEGDVRFVALLLSGTCVALGSAMLVVTQRRLRRCSRSRVRELIDELTPLLP